MPVRAVQEGVASWEVNYVEASGTRTHQLESQGLERHVGDLHRGHCRRASFQLQSINNMLQLLSTFVR